MFYIATRPVFIENSK